MIDSISGFKGTVRKRFCSRCNKEVHLNEVLTDQIIVVNGGYIVKIDDMLLHKECGGIVQTISLNYQNE